MFLHEAHVVDAVRGLDRGHHSERLVARDRVLPHVLGVFDAEAALARAVLPDGLLEGVEDERVGAVSDRVDRELKVGGVGPADRDAPAPRAHGAGGPWSAGFEMKGS